VTGYATCSVHIYNVDNVNIIIFDILELTWRSFT
jgi:hypothetical protein